MSSTTSLPDLLGARRGIVCAVGAGGKKSVLRAIAGQHPGRVAYTGTVPFLPPPHGFPPAVIEAPEPLLPCRVREAAVSGRVVYGLPVVKGGRLGGVPASLIRALHEDLAFDITLVKADGARMRWIKAPAHDEPALVPEADTLIPVLSARAFGEPLGERIAHRPSLVAEITGCALGEPFKPEHAALLMASERGLLKGCARSLVRPVINMVDDDRKLTLARRAAELALAASLRFDQVVLTRLKDPPEVIAALSR